VQSFGVLALGLEDLFLRTAGRCQLSGLVHAQGFGERRLHRSSRVGVSINPGTGEGRPMIVTQVAAQSINDLSLAAAAQ
jgi:hypothetical protein